MKKSLIAFLGCALASAQTYVAPVVSRTETVEVKTQTRLVRIEIAAADPASVRFISTHAIERVVNGEVVGETRTVNERLITRSGTDAVTVDGTTLTRVQVLAFLQAFAEADRGGAPDRRTGMNLQWQDNANNEAGFEIERSEDGVMFARIATVPANTTRYRDETGTVRHVYRVRAFNPSGRSGYAAGGSSS